MREKSTAVNKTTEGFWSVPNWGVSNLWTGIWNLTMEWKIEWNDERTQLQLILVAGTVQSS